MKINNNSITAFSLGLVLMVIYAVSAFNVTISNDAVTNIEQISMGDVLHRSSHFGFIFLGVVFHKLFVAAGVSSAIISTQFMLSLFSVLGAVAFFFLAKKRLGHSQAALIAVLLYALCSNIWRFSIQCEYHVLIPAFGLLAIALWEYGFWFAGGLAFAMGFVTSPFVIFMLPFAIPSFFTQNLRSKLMSFAGFAFLYAVVAFFTIKETLYGEWSYKLVYDYHTKSLASMKPLRVFSIMAYGYLRSFHVMLPFIALGLFYTFKTNRRLFYLFVAGLICHLPAAIPESRYGAYQMTLYPFLTLLVAQHFTNLSGRNKKIFYFTASCFLLLNVYVVGQERGFHRRLADTYTQFNNDPTIPDSTTILIYQATKPFNVVFAPRLKAVPMFTAYQEKQTENLENFDLPDYGSMGRNSKVMYMLESGTSMPDDKLKLMLSSFVKSQGAKLSGFGLEKVKTMYPGARIEPVTGYGFPVYRIYTE